ncbi:MAG: hypothetical protein ACOH5I_16550 [Oligoflexus sp.]
MRRLKSKSILFRITSVLPLMLPNAAYATKAKLLSLQGADFLIDSQTVFENPSDIHALGNYFTLELGGSAANSSPKAEGGLFQEMSGAQVGFYLGHMSAEQTTFRTLNNFLLEENPIDFFYARGNWGASIGISQSDKKTSDESQQTIVGRYGITDGPLNAWANLELISKADKGNDEYQGAPVLRAGASYVKGQYFFSAKLNYGKIENKISGTTTKVDLTGIELLALDRSIKTNQATIYFGPGLKWQEVKVGNAKISNMSLPMYAGIEHKYFDWLDFRASVSQNFLIGSTKDETNAAPGDKADSIANNTTVAAGIGIQQENLSIDATLTASNTGEFNGNSILANLGMIYNF